MIGSAHHFEHTPALGLHVRIAARGCEARVELQGAFLRAALLEVPREGRGRKVDGTFNGEEGGSGRVGARRSSEPNGGGEDGAEDAPEQGGAEARPQ